MVRRVVARGRSPELLPKDPRGHWLSGLDVDTRPADASHFDRFMVWLNKQQGWEYATPRTLLVRHIEAADDYVILDLVQDYVKQLPPQRKSSKRKAYSSIRSYFSHNRCALPLDTTFRIRGDKPPVQGLLTVQDIIEAVHAASLRNRSIILVKWQGFFDSERLSYANQHCADQIVKQIQTHECPVRVDLPGRKENENDIEGAFYTYIYSDAIDALTKYWDEEHCWPRAGQPLWRKEGLEKGQGTVEKAAIEAMWLRLMRHTGKIPRRVGAPGSRYGYNMHEMRDVANTYLHVKAKVKGLDMDCIKFWSGRVGELDPNKYDKFYHQVDWVQSNYKIAGEYLNIITTPDPFISEAEVKTLNERIDELTLSVRMLQDASGLRIVTRNTSEVKA